MSEGRVPPCLSWSTFKVRSLMTCPFCCFNGMPPLTGQLCRQTQATFLGQILNCSESLGCHPQWPVIQPFEITHIQGSPSFEVGEDAANGCDQPVEFDRLGVELVAPCRERLFAFTGERMRGQRDDGDVAGLRT